MVGEARAAERMNFLISGHSLTDEPLSAMVQEIAVSLGREAGWQRQNIIGSPISARTLGHRNDPRDPAIPWTGYSSGRGRDGSPIDLVRELRAPATVEGGTYSHLVVAERHDSLGPLQWEKTVPLLRHFYELAREGSPKIQGFFSPLGQALMESAAARRIPPGGSATNANNCVCGRRSPRVSTTRWRRKNVPIA
jgi:hypothetical protein